jgi:DNA-binding phage protein
MERVYIENHFNDDENVPPSDRAEMKFKSELLGILSKERESGMTFDKLAEVTGLKKNTLMFFLDTTPRLDTIFKLLTPLGYKLVIVPIDPKKRVGPSSFRPLV